MTQSTTETMHHTLIERDRQRAIQFLGAVGRSPRIYHALRDKAGYTQQAHRKGWQLLVRSLGHVDLDTEHPQNTDNAEAIAALTAWDGPNFSRAQAALQVPFPKHSEFLFKGLDQGDGVRSVGVIQAFLERVSLLRESAGQKSPVEGSSIDDDREVLRLLEQRKVIDADTELQLRQWLSQAQQTQEGATPTSTQKSLKQDFQDAVYGLNAWLIDWRGQARAIIKRRDDRIRLGITQRRSKAKLANADDKLNDATSKNEDALLATENSENDDDTMT